MSLLLIQNQPGYREVKG